MASNLGKRVSDIEKKIKELSIQKEELTLRKKLEDPAIFHITSCSSNETMFVHEITLASNQNPYYNRISFFEINLLGEKVVILTESEVKQIKERLYGK